MCLILVLGAASLLLVEAQRGQDQRRREIERRVERVQARELALGAAALVPGTTATVGRWTVRHDRNRRSATSTNGSYVISATGERWEPAR
jgi:hypothetical protein